MTPHEKARRASPSPAPKDGQNQVILEMIDCLRPGGAEGQLVHLVRALGERRWRPRVAVLERVGWHVSELERLGIDLVELPLRGSLLKPNTAWQIARLVHYCRRNEVALIHAQDLYTNFIAMAAGRLSGVPVVVSRLDLAHWFSGARRRAMAALQRRADAVFVNAWAIERMVVSDEGLNPSQVARIANGIDLERFDREARLEPEPRVPGLDGRSVIMVANMQHPVKGQRDVLFAADEVLRHVADAQFFLVGDGDFRPDYERLAGQLGRTGAIHFLGRRSDVPRLLRRAGVAVSASHAEGLSNSVIEAMAARLPVVATDAGGNAELVESGRSGFLVPIGQPSLLAARLVEVLQGDVLRRAMGARARAHVEARLTVDRMGDAFTRLFRHLIDTSRDSAERHPAHALSDP